MSDAEGEGRPDRHGRPDHDTEPIPVVGPGPDHDHSGDARTGDARTGDARAGAADGPARPSWWRALADGERPGWPTLVAAGVAALVLVLLAANAWLAASTEQRLVEATQEELRTEPDVTLRGFPVGFRALLGRVGEAEVRAEEVAVPELGTTLTELELSLTDVRVDRDAGAVEAERATFAVVLDADSLESLLPVIGQLPDDVPLIGDVSELVEIELEEGVARLSVVGFAVVDATAEIRNGDLVLSPSAPLGQIGDLTIAIDELPLGFAVDDVRIRPEGVRLEGSAAPFSLEDVDVDP